MTKPLINCEETICAISSAAGAAARAIVRVSGDDAMKIGDQIFTSASGTLASAKGFTFVDGVISATLSAGVVELPARAYVFHAPHSYTRQDLVEFHIPGSPVAAAAILDEIISRGARQSHAGEFTARAFVLGRIDLSQAEAVADIINAEDDAHARAAMAALGGTIHTLCHSAAAELADLLALVEASIDLSDQGISFDNPSAPASQLRAIGARLEDLISHSGDMPDSSAMPTVAIAGLPNAGKSSLMNAIVGAERSIVSGVAGTTRDVLSWRVELKDFGQVELQDLAGIDDGDCAIASAARRAAWRAVEAASAIIFVADVSSVDLAPAEKLLNEISRINPRSPVIVVGNKNDLIPDAAARLENFASQSAVSKKLTASATAGDGIDSLIAELRRVLTGDCQLGGCKLGLHLRQRRCLSLAAEAIDRCAGLLDDAEELADVAELAAVELRQSLWQIGQVSGQVVTEDILGRIFRRFCVGK